MRRILIMAVLAGLIPPFVFSQTTGREAHSNTAGLRAAEKNGKNNWPRKSWEKAKTPEELGWSSERLKQARQLAGTFDTAAVVIVDDGIVVDEWGEIDKKFNVHSIRKSFLSALYGLAVKEAKINLNSTMAELGIDDNEPALTTEEKQARVVDLLKARSGVYHPALYETAGMKAARPKRGSHPPNTFWYYNNWDFNALGTIFEKAMKSTIAKEFGKRIAQPLQMEDFKVGDVEYVNGADSIHPAYPFRMTARDMARFGLLFLRNGEWHSKQVIPKEWVSESTSDEWWGNCAWCSLGVAALLNRDVTITTTLGANHKQVDVHIKDGQVVETDYWVHFPVPMRSAWDNVIYTCSTMLLFESERHIDLWSKKHRIAKGDVQTITQIWEFSKAWYGNHLDPEWKKWTAEEAQRMFERFELTSEIWKIPISESRF